MVKANDIEIISDNIIVLNNGSIIKSKNTEAKIEHKSIYIKGDFSTYNKDRNVIIFKNNVFFQDKLKNIQIETDEAIYKQIEDQLNTKNKTKILIDKKYTISSKNIFYDRKNQEVFSDDETTIVDTDGNTYNFEDKFYFDLNKEEITTEKVNIIDNDNNIYLFELAKINLKTKEIAGKELKIDFKDSYFGNPNNDPILKGKSAVTNENETKIYKTVFSTCNTENKKCPGWEIETEEFIHDKTNKVFNYKNSWIKVFDQEIFYLPFFSHPDPTVNRKSGFLVPYYGNSNNFGSWVNIPYFKVLNKDKDLTFNPRIYADDKFILQTEYRQYYEKTKLVTDFSYNNDGKNSNSHLFTKLSGDIDGSSSYNFSYQSVTNDNYLKIHNLSNSSPLITDESLLTSKFNYSKTIDDNTSFKTNFIAYEDLSKRKNDRFQYIFPNFTFLKNIDLGNDYNGNYQFKSSGFQKSYETNKYETLLINDFLYSSENFFSNYGFLSDYDILIKNFNSYTENSTSYKNKDDYEVFGSFIIKTSLPMKKISNLGNNYLKPIASFRYSPNNTKNISNKDIRLSYDNIFSLNRIGTNEIVEGGKSIALGVEYDRKDKNENNLFGFRIANTLRDRKNDNLPFKSNLDQKRSDIVGKTSFYPNNFLSFDYNFSLDNNLRSSNYDSLTAKLNYSFFSTQINFLSKDENIGDDEIISNSTTFNLNDEKSLNFKITKNLKNDFTENYNLNYGYNTDCLNMSFDFNKRFYSDGNLKPEKSLFFTIKFIPFAEFRQSADMDS
tara:strand:+ start:174 stop:2507 length:2334 start_codon:yes stop_codon:yes gene_type:complete